MQTRNPFGSSDGTNTEVFGAFNSMHDFKITSATGILFIIALAAALGAFVYGVRVILHPLVLFVVCIFLLFPYRDTLAGRNLLILLVSLLVLWGIYTLRGVLSPFIVALIFAYIFNPVVAVLSRKIPRTLAILLIMFTLLLVMVLLGFYVLPPVYRQISGLVNEVSNYYSSTVSPWLDRTLRSISAENEMLKNTLDSTIEELKAKAPIIAESVSSFVSRIFFGVAGAIFRTLGFLIIPVIFFYILKEFESLKSYFRHLIPEGYSESALAFLHEVDTSMGQYLRGQLSICLIVATMTAVGLGIIGVEYFLLIGIVAGIANIIPFLGPLIGATPAVFVVIASPDPSWIKLIMVVLLFVGIQALDSMLISPRVMGKTLNVSPVIIILAVLIGSYVAGPVGMLLAVPTVCVIRAGLKWQMKTFRFRKSA